MTSSKATVGVAAPTTARQTPWAEIPWPRLPWSVARDLWVVLCVYVIARAISFLMFIGAARHQVTAHSSWDVASRPDYLSFVARMWDASWYYEIASSGYPVEVPVDALGKVQQNAWAFYPLFPGLANAVMRLGLPWNLVAPTLSLAFGGLAMVFIYRAVALSVRRTARLSEDVIDTGRRADDGARWIALGAVALTSFFPSSPVLQTGYTESLALCLIALALWLLVRRSYWWCLLPVIALGFSRAVALPFACVVAVHLYVRWREGRGEQRVARRDYLAIGVLGVVSVVSGFAWQFIMAIATGSPNAYVETQYAWRWFQTVFPGASWVMMADYVLGWPGVLVLIGLVCVAVWALVARRSRVLGPELLAWAGFYVLYLVGVAEPQTSIARFMILAFPFGAILMTWSKSRAYLIALVSTFTLLQVAWVVMLWTLNSSSGYPP